LEKKRLENFNISENNIIGVELENILECFVYQEGKKKKAT